MKLPNSAVHPFEDADACEDEMVVDIQKHGVHFENDPLIKPEVQSMASFGIQRLPTKIEARILILFLAFILGSLHSYQHSVMLELQRKKANWHQQSNFLFIYFPYFGKLFIAPFVDRYFFKSLGKCRTYIGIGGCLLSTSLFVLSAQMDDLVFPQYTYHLLWIFFMINVMAVLVKLASSLWIIKLFAKDDEKSKGQMMDTVGYFLGELTGYNLFIPLHSTSWLNDHIFTSNPISSPILSHQAFLIILASIVAILTVVIILFVGEQVSSSNQQASLGQVFKLIPRMFAFKNTRNLLLFILLTRGTRHLVDSALRLSYVKNGLQLTVFATIDTFAIPFFLLSNFIFFLVMKKGNLMKICIVLLIVDNTISLLSYGVYNDYMNAKNISRTYYLLLVKAIIGSFLNSIVFIHAYINIVTPLKYGSTFIAVFLCWVNICFRVPEIIGMKLIAVGISLDVLYVVVFSIDLLITILYFKYCCKLDTMDKKEFNPDQEIQDGIARGEEQAAELTTSRPNEPIAA